jgi:transcriptional regulator with XRE-family HTH domain
MGKFSVNKLPSDILKSTASNTAALRKELKLTQADLSVKSGVSYGSIKRLDRLSDFEELLIPKGNKKVEDLFKTLQ